MVAILIATALFPPEPVVSARLSYDLARYLAGEQSVIVVAPRATRPFGMALGEFQCDSCGFKHVLLDSYTCPKSNILGRFWESISFGLKLRRYIVENHRQIDVIYANVWPLFAQNILVRAASKFGIPVVLHIQDVYPEFLSSKLNKVLGWLVQKIFLPLDESTLRNTSNVVVISEQMKAHISKSRGVDLNRIIMVRNWQNDSEFGFCLDAPERNNEMFTFLYLGSINPTANVELVVEAFGKAAIPGSELVVAGDGPNRKSCEHLAASFSAKIRFQKVKPDEVPLVQSQADVLLLPLKKGVGGASLPSKMTAYMFSGKPILASIDRDSEAAEIIEQSNSGVVVDAESKVELAEKMRFLASLSADELREFGDNALKFAQENLSRESNLEKLANVVSMNLPERIC